MAVSDRDSEDYGPPEYGVRSSDLGSFIPEGTYRPKPIVWFAAAWFLQTIPLSILFLVLSNKPPIFTALTSALITFWIAHMTWRRGMDEASSTWQIVTIVALVVNWGLVTFGAFALHW